MINATNAAISIDEKCNFKYVRDAWVFKEEMPGCFRLLSLHPEAGSLPWVSGAAPRAQPGVLPASARCKTSFNCL